VKPNVEKLPTEPDSKANLKSLPLLEAETRLGSSPKGLTQAEALKRLAQYGPNEIKEKSLARWQQVRIRLRGMHLDRKHFMYIEKLQQQRESPEAPGQLSQYLLRKLLQQLTDGLSLENSISDAALMVVAIAE